MSIREPLLPELAEWNHGAGIDAFSWLYSIARSDVAVAYSKLFWPTFVRFEGYVLREGYSVESVRSWERAENSSRKLVEAFVNTLDIGELLTMNNEEWSPLAEQRSIYVCRVVADAHAAKLARDFPELTFHVDFFDGSQEEDGAISLSFWQV